MSLRAEPFRSIPEDTARVARVTFRRRDPYLMLRDRLGPVFTDAHFADLYPRHGQPAYAPWRLALDTLMQFREGLSDRQAADAVRRRIDSKYLLSLDIDDAGFDFSVLCEFRAWLLRHAAAGRLLDRLPAVGRRPRGGLLQARGRSRDLQHPRARCHPAPQPPGAFGQDAACGAQLHRRHRPALLRNYGLIPAGLRGDLFDPGVAAKGPDAIGFGEEAHPGVASRASMMASVEWGRRSGRRRLRRWSQTRSTGSSSGL